MCVFCAENIVVLFSLSEPHCSEYTSEFFFSWSIADPFYTGLMLIGTTGRNTGFFLP